MYSKAPQLREYDVIFLFLMFSNKFTKHVNTNKAGKNFCIRSVFWTLYNFLFTDLSFQISTYNASGYKDYMYWITTFILNLQRRDDVDLCLVYSPHHNQQTEDTILR